MRLTDGLQIFLLLKPLLQSAVVKMPSGSISWLILCDSAALNDSLPIYSAMSRPMPLLMQDRISAALKVEKSSWWPLSTRMSTSSQLSAVTGLVKLAYLALFCGH